VKLNSVSVGLQSTKSVPAIRTKDLNREILMNSAESMISSSKIRMTPTINQKETIQMSEETRKTQISVEGLLSYIQRISGYVYERTPFIEGCPKKAQAVAFLEDLKKKNVKWIE
jgi:hypothetical protein